MRDRVRAGKLHALHRGIYAVGHRALQWDGHLMAAVLACGDGAVLSHRSAAQRWDLRKSASTRIDVTSPTRAGRRRRGISVHSGATLTAADIAVVKAIPCTSVARTLLDLAETTDRNALQRAVERAEVLSLFDLIATRELLKRSNGRRGAQQLKKAIAAHVPTITRNEMEALFLAICENAGLPRPLTNEWLGDIQPDFMWPKLKLIVETDGYDTHGTRQALVADRQRDRRLRKEGWRVERFTWWEISETPAAVGAELADLLAAQERLLSATP